MLTLDDWESIYVHIAYVQAAELPLVSTGPEIRGHAELTRASIDTKQDPLSTACILSLKQTSTIQRTTRRAPIDKHRVFLHLILQWLPHRPLHQLQAHRMELRVKEGPLHRHGLEVHL
jgi:hypothetical protein